MDALFGTVDTDSCGAPQGVFAPADDDLVGQLLAATSPASIDAASSAALTDDECEELAALVATVPPQLPPQLPPQEEEETQQPEKHQQPEKPQQQSEKPQQQPEKPQQQPEKPQQQPEKPQQTRQAKRGRQSKTAAAAADAAKPPDSADEVC